MSTGIGKHKYTGHITQHAAPTDLDFSLSPGCYQTETAICPYCQYDGCDADFVDIGIGMQQCGPYHCPKCGASEVSSLDARELLPIEAETGWYAPGTPASENANTVGGMLVDHETARRAYQRGMLDDRPELPPVEDDDDFAWLDEVLSSPKDTP